MGTFRPEETNHALVGPGYEVRSVALRMQLASTRTFT